MSGSVEKITTNIPKFNGTNAEINRIIGDILVREFVIDQQTLSTTLRSMQETNCDKLFLGCIRRCQPDLPLGTLLTELGLITRARLDQILHYQAHDYYQIKLGELLVRNGLLRELDLTQILAAQHGINSEEPDIIQCDQVLLQSLSLETCSEFGFLPIRAEANQIVVAFVDPMDQRSRTAAARMLSTGIIPVMSSNSTIKKALKTLASNKLTSGGSLQNLGITTKNTWKFGFIHCWKTSVGTVRVY